MEPKAQCKVCLSYCDVGIVYCTCGHFLRNVTEENKKFVKYTMDLFSILNYYRKGDSTGTFTGRSQGITITTSRIGSRSTKRSFTWVSTTGSSEAKSSARTCLTSIAPNKYVVRWTNWRTKTTRTRSLQKKFVCTETIDGFVRTQLVPIRCQFGIDLISSKHCQVCDSSKIKEDAAHQQRWQSSSSSWWNWQESRWHSSSEHHYDDEPSRDWSGKPVEKWLGYLFEAGFLELIWWQYSSKFDNS